MAKKGTLVTNEPPEPRPELAKLPVEDANPLYETLSQAIASGKSAEEMHKLMDFIDRAEKFAAEKAFNSAMSACQAEMPVVVREAQNAHTKSKYARLEHVQAAIKPVYTKHGFSLTFGTFASSLPGHIGVYCDCLHVGGFTRQYRGDYPLDDAGSSGTKNKTGIQATGSTYSYARRYLTLMVFNITIADEDTDGAGYSPPLNGDQIRELCTMIENVRSLPLPVPFGFERFARAMGIAEVVRNGATILEAETLARMKQSRFVEAVRGLREKAETATEAKG